MVLLSGLLEVLKFQLKRDVYFLMKMSLELLEKDRDNGLKLEKLLESAGFEDKELFKSEENFKNARKVVLDNFNNSLKEINDLVEKFNIDRKEE